MMQPEGRGTPATVEIVGHRSSVTAAQLLIDAQLQFERTLKNERARHEQLQAQLQKMDLDYGDEVRA